jgi:NADPH-dependent curcumin reductase CurA
VVCSYYPHREWFDDFERDVSGWMKEGRFKYREDIAQGMEGAVPAFQGLLEGRNFGKQLVQLSDDPTR